MVGLWGTILLYRLGWDLCILASCNREVAALLRWLFHCTIGLNGPVVPDFRSMVPGPLGPS